MNTVVLENNYWLFKNSVQEQRNQAQRGYLEGSVIFCKVISNRSEEWNSIGDNWLGGYRPPDPLCLRRFANIKSVQKLE